MIDSIEFYEGELELIESPEELKELLTDLHEELELTSLTDLLRYYEEVEKYEFCQTIKEFCDENGI